jgi:hypothetical protein
MDIFKRVSLAMELERLEERFPYDVRLLREFGYLLATHQHPHDCSLHGKVASDATIFRKHVELESTDRSFPLFNPFTISAVIVDTSEELDIPYDTAVVFSAELFLGQRNNLYLERMYQSTHADPMVVERLFIATALQLQFSA